MKRQKPHLPPDPAAHAPKASAADLTLHSRTIGVLPIISRLIERCQLRETLGQYLPADDGRSRVDTVTAILLLVRNILISREPIYGIGAWSASFVPELLDLREDQLRSLNDDRVGRALDRLFDAATAEMVLEMTQNVVHEFQLELSELHNDSTTVKFCGVDIYDSNFLYFAGFLRQRNGVAPIDSSGDYTTSLQLGIFFGF